MKQKIRNTLLLTTALALTACGDNRPPEEIVKELANKRWEAMVNRKFDEVFQTISPAKRQIINQAVFQDRIAALLYTGAEVKSVTCSTTTQGEAIDSCKVKVYVHVKRNKKDMGASAMLTDTWALEQGKWWFVPR